MQQKRYKVVRGGRGKERKKQEHSVGRRKTCENMGTERRPEKFEGEKRKEEKKRFRWQNG